MRLGEREMGGGVFWRGGGAKEGGGGATKNPDIGWFGRENI
jgi:hypothetical protein